MDDLIKQLIEAAESSGAKVQVLGVNAEKVKELQKRSDKLEVIELTTHVFLEGNDSLALEGNVATGRFGTEFLEETLGISEEEIRKIYMPTLVEFQKCTLKLDNLITDKLNKGESNNDSKN